MRLVESLRVMIQPSCLLGCVVIWLVLWLTISVSMAVLNRAVIVGTSCACQVCEGEILLVVLAFIQYYWLVLCDRARDDLALGRILSALNNLFIALSLFHIWCLNIFWNCLLLLLHKCWHSLLFFLKSLLGLLSNLLWDIRRIFIFRLVWRLLLLVDLALDISWSYLSPFSKSLLVLGLALILLVLQSILLGSLVADLLAVLLFRVVISRINLLGLLLLRQSRLIELLTIWRSILIKLPIGFC